MSYKPLFRAAAVKMSVLLLITYGVFKFRDLQQHVTYRNFKGRMMTLGPMSTLTHEPLSVEEVDKLKAAERERKAAERASRSA